MIFRKILFGIFITVCIAGGIYYFIYVKNLKAPVCDGINAIPLNAAFVLESKQVKNVWKKLSQTNIMWEQLLGTQTFSEINYNAKYLDSLLNLNPEISQLLENHSVFISAHCSDDKTYDLLYVYSLPNLTFQSSLEDFIKMVNNNSKPSQTDYAGVTISTIHPKGKREFIIAIYKGTMIMSANQSLVQESIRQLKTGKSLMKEKYFSNIISSAGKNVDANLYVNYKNFPALINRFISGGFNKEINTVACFADCSGWDITIKPNALTLNGFTQASDSLNNFLNLFTTQKPQKTELTKILPEKTSLLIYFGISNVKAFHKDYRNYLKLNHRFNDEENYFRELNEKYEIDLEEGMLGLLNNEMAVAVTQPSSEDILNNTFGIVRTNNAEKAIRYLNETITTINKSEKQKQDTTRFRDHIISKLSLPDLLSHLLGLQFDKVKSNYFTLIDDYLVFANSEEALRNFINDFEFNKTLTNDKNYKSFAENISSDANVYVYSSIVRSGNIYGNFLKEQFAKELELKKDLFHKFESVGIQFSSSDKAFYSSAYLKYNPEQKQETGTLWEAKLDTTLSSKPYLVTNHNTGGKEIFVQDDNNKIYLISNTGKIIWTKQLNEKIISEVTQIDAMKTNKLQLLFNTHSEIYLIDRNGNDMKGFPVKLKSPATNSIIVVDYDNNKDYRIFVATENKRILSFKGTGELVDGFKFDKTTNSVLLPMQYFKLKGKDNLCAVDVKGRIYLIDRHGESKTKVKEHFPQGINNFFIETGKDNSSTYLIAADTLGNINKISITGNKETLKFQEFETSPYYKYSDINNDDINEHIFLTRKELKVFSPDKTLLFKYEFKNTITQNLQSFVFPDLMGKIGVVCEAENKIYLFNDNGSVYNSFPLTGKTLFNVGDINNDGNLNVVVGSADNSIYLYQIEY